MDFKNYKADTCTPLKKAWQKGELELSSLVRLDYPGKPLPTKMLKGVNSIGYWDAHMPQNWGLDWHRNEGIEITYLETGSMPISTENIENAQLMANHFTIMRPWQLHKLGNPNIGVGRLYWLILDVNVRNPHQAWKWPSWIVISRDDLKELTKILRQNEKIIWQSDSKIRSCFNEIGKVVSSNDLGHIESELVILINSLLLSILNVFRRGNVSLDKTLMESKRTVELFLTELPFHIEKAWTLESMANQCNLGTTRFVHFCKKITNMTPVEYLNYLRLEKASKLLNEGKIRSIQEIAYDCGFTSGQYFATQFKKQYGCTPKQFNKPYSLH
ncbi:MAG: helix-turn-helix transcriptional regulator [Flavobacteriaceae bacterium]